MAALQVDVLSPSKPMAKVEAIGVGLPGSMGYMEILPNHAPMVAELDCGHLRVKKVSGNDVLHFFIAGGYVSVLNNEVQVLADVIETPEEIDLERAESALTRAQERLNDKKGSEVDLQRALESVRRARARLDFIKAVRGQAH